MSYTTIDLAQKDPALNNRVIAAAVKEAHNNATLAATQIGQTIRENPAEGVRFVWPTAIDYEAQYASALAADNPNPGGDESVITDANIQAAVQAHWPEDDPT